MPKNICLVPKAVVPYLLRSAEHLIWFVPLLYDL